MVADRSTALIAGAGPGGLATAIALDRVGIPSLLLERSPELRTAGAGILLQVNAMRSLARLGVDENVRSRGIAVSHVELHDERGRVLSSMDLARAAGALGASVAIHRGDLAQALASELDSNAIRFDAAVDTVEQDEDAVVVRLESGGTVETPILVGADGLRSTTRRAVFGELPLRYSGYTCWRGVVDASAPAGKWKVVEMWGRGCRFGIVPISPTRTYWFATANAEAGLDRDRAPAELHVEVSARYASFDGPVRDLIAATPPEAILRNDIVDLAPIATWTSGRVALLGDAAHAMTPNMGQGAAMAIEDALFLAHELRDGEAIPEALRRYAAARRSRVVGIVQQSWQLGRLGQAESWLMRGLRNRLTAWMPATWVEKNARKLWSIDLPA